MCGASHRVQEDTTPGLALSICLAIFRFHVAFVSYWVNPGPSVFEFFEVEFPILELQ
jgi:hypothetical protein